MSAEGELHFEQPGLRTCVRLPTPPSEIIRDWQMLRTRMIREQAPEFSRDEWAYLIHFLGADRLDLPWRQSFGTVTDGAARADLIAVPARRIAVWMPNNVSLLGCLTLALISLTGAQVRVKCGSRSADLCTPFAEYARKHLPAGALRRWFEEDLDLRRFEREHPDNIAMAAWADARIFFGGDEGARGVASLPSQIGTPFFAFANRVSEAWITPASARVPETALTLAKVFAIYGQAGCTSPKRAIIVGGDRTDALAFSDALALAWTAVIREPASQAQASEVVMAAQWARAQGLEARTLEGNAATLVLSPVRPSQVFGHLALQVQWGSLYDTLKTGATNLQTVGTSEMGSLPAEWRAAVASTSANRLVPLARMHDFSHIWDGQPWWRNLFRIIET